MAKNDRARRKRQRSEQTDLLERIKKWSRENRTDGPSGTEVLESPQPPSPCATTIEAAKRSSRAFREALDSAWLPDMTGNPIDPRDPSVQAIDALREEILELLTDERETDEGPSPSNDQPTQPRRKEMSDEDLSERLKAARRNAGQTQETAAEALTLTTSTVARIEQGKQGVRNETLARICEYIKEHLPANA